MIASPPVQEIDASLQATSLSGAMANRSGSISEPLKVLYFYQDFGQMGGIERYLSQLATWLPQRGLVQPIFVCCQGTPLYEQLCSLGARVHGLPSHPIFSKSFLRSFDLVSFYRLFRIIQQVKPDVLHVHIGLLENVLFRRWGLPVVYTFHGYSTLFSMDGVTSKLKRAFKSLTRVLFQKTARSVDALLFVSHAERDRMAQEGYLPTSAPATVVHNGLPVMAWQAQVKQVNRAAVLKNLGLPAHSRCITYINRLDENKNPLQFLELAARLANDARRNGWHFLIAGDGPLAEEVRMHCETSSQVHYLGYRTDVATLLAISDVVVYPARREGFGLGLVEAMAASVPCVAYASGGATEILDVPGTRECLVPVDDFSALVHNTKRILTLPEAERNNLQQALFNRALDFDSLSLLGRLEHLYRVFTPKVSVILPVYNGGELVKRAVASVLGQTYRNLELIVVDDGSTDDTLQRLAEIHDPRLLVLPKENQGVAVARNYGFKHATGEYIAFIDADDLWFSNKLAVELQTLRRHINPENPSNPVALVYSSYYAVDEQERLINLPEIHREEGNLSKAVLDYEGLFLPSTSLVHRQVFEAVGGFKPACYHEDRVFFIEACQQFPAYSTGQRLVAYQQSLSGRCRSILQDYEQALNAELSIVDSLRLVLPVHTIEDLALRQKRNLIFRFLMYNYAPHARRLYAQLEAEAAPSLGLLPPDLFDGKKGQLALFSLDTGLNVLATARKVFQTVTTTVLSPWWIWKLRRSTAAKLTGAPVFNADF